MLSEVVAIALLASGANAGQEIKGSSATTKPVKLTVAASGDFLIHQPVWSRALADGGGRRYDFRSSS